MSSPIESPRILLVEDDEKLTSLITLYLEKQGMQVSCEHMGSLAPARIIQEQPDLVILDLMLPGKDGLSICREIRADYQGKVLILTASDDDMDQVAALEMGADDFVIKPLQPRVLLARIRMLLRRQELLSDNAGPAETGRTNQKAVNGHQLEYGCLKLHQPRRECLLHGEMINLTPSEFDLIWLLASHADNPLSREHLVREVRGIEYDGLDRTIDNKVVSLRKKLGDDPQHPHRLITVRSKGYLFASESW